MKTKNKGSGTKPVQLKIAKTKTVGTNKVAKKSIPLATSTSVLRSKLSPAKTTKATTIKTTTIKATTALKVSVTEHLSNSRLVKSAEAVKLKTQRSELKLVAKGVSKVVVAKLPATKISRSESTSYGSKIIAGVFSVDTPTPKPKPTLVTRASIEKVVTQSVAPVDVISFKVGDKIVYPGHGVGEVEGVRTTVLGGQEHHIYNIKILESGMKVMVPLSQASSVGLRKVVDKRAIDEVYTILKDRDFKIDTQTWNRRFREYSQKIKTGSVYEIAIVLRDLSVLSADKELSFGEKKMLDMAESLLVSEIAIAKARPHDKVAGELKALFT